MSIISSDSRPQMIQALIDDSFEIRVLPLHQQMFKGVLHNYLFVGRDSDYTFNDSKRSIRGIKASEIASQFASKDTFTILDLGCGVGGFLLHMKNRFSNAKVFGVSAADFRNTRYDKQEQMLSDKEYIVANIENLHQVQALKNKKFDFIVSAITFRHLSDPLGVICQAYDLLNENGILLVDNFVINGISDADHVLEILNEAGCRHVEVLTSGYIVEQIKIRKIGLERLILPIRYDLSRSKRADENRQAEIYYCRDVKKIEYSQESILAMSIIAFFGVLYLLTISSTPSDL